MDIFYKIILVLSTVLILVKLVMIILKMKLNKNVKLVLKVII